MGHVTGEGQDARQALDTLHHRRVAQNANGLSDRNSTCSGPAYATGNGPTRLRQASFWRMFCTREHAVPVALGLNLGTTSLFKTITRRYPCTQRSFCIRAG